MLHTFHRDNTFGTFSPRFEPSRPFVPLEMTAVPFENQIRVSTDLSGTIIVPVTR